MKLVKSIINATNGTRLGEVAEHKISIEKAFNKLTGDSGRYDGGKIRGTTKKEVRKLCGSDWNERAWKRMINLSNKFRNSSNRGLPIYDRKQKLWFWY